MSTSNIIIDKSMTQTLLDEHTIDEESLLAVESIICSSLSREKTNEDKKLRYWDIVVIHATYSTAGGIVVMPYMFGQLGYVLGPIVLGLWMFLLYCINAFVCDIVLASGGRCKTLGDIGAKLAGTHGRLVLRGIQLLNMLLYLPTALETIALSLQYIGNKAFNHESGCVGYWKLIVFGLLVVLLQVMKSWKDSAIVSYLIFALVVFKALVLLPYGFVEYKDDYIESKFYQGASLAFGNPDPKFWDMISGILTWVFTGIFFVVESMAETKNPKEYKSALRVGVIIMYILYIVPGLMCVLMWGWNHQYLVNLELPYGWMGILLNVLIALPTLLDYIISSLVINEAISMKFLKPPECQITSWRYQLKKTLPSTILAFVICVIIPNFDTLVQIGTSITIVPTCTWLVSVLWLVGGRIVPGVQGFGSPELKLKTLHWTSILIGLPMTVLVFATAIHGLINTDFSGNHLWCGKIE